MSKATARDFPALKLNKLVVRNAQAMGYVQPREIQSRAIPHILAGRDVLALAETGMGKTAAFAAGIIHVLLERRGERGRAGGAARLRALMICPTRELAQQVAREVSGLCAGTSLRADCVYGQASLARQAESLSKGVDVLIGTPGRMRELVEHLVISLAYVRHVVLDEADRLLDMGFLPQIAWLMQRVSRPCQRIMFTATIPPEVEDLARSQLEDPVRVSAGRVHMAGPDVAQSLIAVQESEKVACLLDTLNRYREMGMGTGVLIFCGTRRTAERVARELAAARISAMALHGDRSQAQREQSLRTLARGGCRALVCTDVAARGLHIPAVQLVINFDLPASAEDFLHRVGRAGHGGGAGAAVTMVSREQEPRWTGISRMFSLTLEPAVFAAPQDESLTPRAQERLGRHELALGGSEKDQHRRKPKRDPRTQGRFKKRTRREAPLLVGKRMRPGRAPKNRPIDPREQPGKGVRKA